MNKTVIGLIVAAVVCLLVGFVLGSASVSTAEVEQEIESLESQVGSLQSQLDNANTQVSQLQSQLDEKATEISALVAQLTSKDAEIEELMAEIDSKNDEIANLTSQIQNLESRIATLETLIPPYEMGAWNPIASFQGTSDQDTEYFYVAGTELRINWTWTSTSQAFGFFLKLYKEGETFPIATFQDLDSEGTTRVHNIEPAKYYLQISESNIDQWTVTVEVWIPELE